MTTKEIALTICEKIQNEYPKRPIWQTMLEIEDLIDKHVEKQLSIYGVSSSLIVNIKSFGGFIDKLCETDYTKRTKQYKYKNNWYGFTELKKIYKADFL